MQIYSKTFFDRKLFLHLRLKSYLQRHEKTHKGHSSHDVNGGGLNGHEYADLGLPNGTLWTTATNPWTVVTVGVADITVVPFVQYVPRVRSDYVVGISIFLGDSDYYRF